MCGWGFEYTNEYQGNISSRFSSNSEAFTSELLENQKRFLVSYGRCVDHKQMIIICDNDGHLEFCSVLGLCVVQRLLILVFQHSKVSQNVHIHSMKENKSN